MGRLPKYLEEKRLRLESAARRGAFESYVRPLLNVRKEPAGLNIHRTVKKVRCVLMSLRTGYEKRA